MSKNIDQKILRIVQNDFPVTEEPFRAIAQMINSDEQYVIERIKELKAQKIIRQISPIFDSSQIGYHSTLAAFAVPEDRIEEVAQILNKHTGVSHNYLRDGRYNIWFALTVLKEIDLKDEIARLANESGTPDWLYLPSIKTFCISFKLDMGPENDYQICEVHKVDPQERFSDEESLSPAPSETTTGQHKSDQVTIDRDFIRELQSDIALVHRPFKAAAEKLGRREKEIVDQLKRYIDGGLIRRFAAILRPVEAGYIVNVLVAWAPQQEKIEQLGTFAASLGKVSHCYQRPSDLSWPYSIYTMIHGRTETECEEVIEEIRGESGVEKFCSLPTRKEFKKVRVRYFE